MPNVTISCPHCGFTREVPQDRVPAGVANVRCPKCGESFAWDGGAPLFQDMQEPASEPGAPRPEEPQPEKAAAEAAGEGEGAQAQGPAGTPFAGLPPVGSLLGRAWEIYQRRFGTLILLLLFAIFSLLLSVLLFAGIGALLSGLAPDMRRPLIAAGVVTGLMAGLAVMFWGIGAFICAVTDESLGMREALENGWQLFGPFLWLFSLTGFIAGGGFLLLVIPGIIFSVWFVFAKFILVAEGERGMDAVLKSKEYVRGRWGEVFGRLFVIWFFETAVSSIPYVGVICALFFAPYAMIARYLLYKDVKAVRGPVPSTYPTSEKALWIGIGAIGYIALPIIAILLVGAFLTSMFVMMKGMMFGMGH
ncbi:MAG: zinc-ribbon domain-containing protein [Geobacter sp.]|nr:zinc-ribbon domain-containing protein [Geobacter sp.]